MSEETAGLWLARPGAWGWEMEGRREAPRVAAGPEETWVKGYAHRGFSKRL